MTDTEPVDEQPVIRPFADVLLELRKGGAHADLSQQLHDLLAAVKDTGKGGTLTLQIVVKPIPKTNTVTVTDVIKTKAPEGDKATSVFFLDRANRLTRDDPNQPYLPLREVPTAADKPMREATAR